MVSVMLWQFLELCIVFLTPVEEIASFLLDSEVLTLPDDFTSGAGWLN
jgi:hypothetical protein